MSEPVWLLGPSRNVVPPSPHTATSFLPTGLNVLPCREGAAPATRPGGRAPGRCDEGSRCHLPALISLEILDSFIFSPFYLPLSRGAPRSRPGLKGVTLCTLCRVSSQDAPVTKCRSEGRKERGWRIATCLLSGPPRLVPAGRPGARAHSPAAGRSPRCARGSGAARRAAAGGVPGAHPGVLQVVRLRTASVGGCRKGRGAGPHLPRAWGPEGTGRRRVEVRAPWRLARSGCPTDHDEGHPRRRHTHDAAHPRRRPTHEQGRAGRGACRRAVWVGPGETRSACGKRGGVHGQRLDPP